MAYYYQSRGYHRPSPFGGFSFFPPVIKWLLLVNGGVFLADELFFSRLSVGGIPISYWFNKFFALIPVGGFVYAPGFEASFHVWQLVTYMFLHGGFWHLFLNMFALWMFGMELENMWGSRKFLTYYLVCGVSGGIANLVFSPMLGQAGPTVGASGAIYGVLVAFGLIFPDRNIYLYFLLPIKAKYFIAGFVGLSLYNGVMGTEQGVAHFAHLGGAAAGFVYVLADMGLIPVRRWWNHVRELYQGLSDRSGQARIYKRKEDVRDARFYDIKTGRSMDEENEISQEVIDAILDKISRSGYQSLTDDEKRILNEASKKIH
jgi:membrane associated rhomboid family serine protease